MKAAYRAPESIDCPRQCVPAPNTTYYPISADDAPTRPMEDVIVCPFDDCQQHFLRNRDDSDQ